MRRLFVSFFAFSLMTCAAHYLVQRSILRSSSQVEAATNQGSQGELISFDKDGHRLSCPLKHTSVKADITGFLSRTTVTQEFENSFTEPIEAVYTFPLPQNAAVDDMTMLVGGRTIRGKIKRREEAQAIYDAARSAGQRAALLDQERPNMFTQSVANIGPGEQIKITISYVETLKYEGGTYEFVFPMVVGPRYIPGEPTGKQGGGMARDTNRVTDASRITPQVTPKGTRAGHDISIEVSIESGVPIDSLSSTTHEIMFEKTASNQAIVRLKNLNEIPNKDFILKYDVAGKKIQDAILTHRSGQGGFFTMILQPPERVTAKDVSPKELVFVLDTSGSMEGFPIEKAKECMKLALDGLYPQDTFNLITFSGDTHILFPQPVPATPTNLQKAQEFLKSRSGGGGTEMMKAIQAALDPSDAQDHVRIVCFMTDGYVGNDLEIIAEIQKHPNARVFSFGIGSSVNRYLLDKMAEEGRGEVEYVGLNDDGSAAARRLHERIRNPLMTDISIDWSGIPVADVYPKRIPDLFSAKPVIVFGRYLGAWNGTVRLHGKLVGHESTREIQFEMPASEPRHDVLATLWARNRIDDLMRQDLNGIQRGNARLDVRETITQLGLEFRLMTQFTSLVAVEETTVMDRGVPRRIEVPVEMPEGVSRRGVFGDVDKNEEKRVTVSMSTTTPVPASSEVVEVTTGNNNAEYGRNGSGGGGGSGIRYKARKAPNPVRRTLDERVAPINRTDDLKQTESNQKVHPAIAKVLEQLKKPGAQPKGVEAKFIKDGKAEIQVWLTDNSSETIEKLRKLGFEVILESKSTRTIIGRLAVEKLAALAEIKEVRYVAPFN